MAEGHETGDDGLTCTITLRPGLRFHQMRSTVGSGPYRFVAGNRADTLDRPARGMTGNTHQVMMDRNGEAVAGLVADWIAQLPAAP